MRRLTAVVVTALLLAGLLAVNAAADPSEYGIKMLSATETTDQAGAHPDLTLAFELNREGESGPLPSTTRDLSIELPPGLLGNPNAITKCSGAQLMTTDVEDKSNATGCPQDSQIGITQVRLFKNGSVVGFTEPVFNMQAPDNEVARIGFIADFYPIFLGLHLRSDGDYGITVTAEGTASLIPLLSASTTTWGVPAAEIHDAERITAYEAVHGGTPETPNGKRQSGLVPAPFLVNPTRCGVPREVKLTATSYADPAKPVNATTALPQIIGCGKVGFEPNLTLSPSSREAAAPTGLDADLTMRQDETVAGRSTSALRYARVTLPEGMTIAPGAGNGLEACSADQVGLGTVSTSACPDAAKIGTAEIDVPALSRPIEGSVYQRTPVKGNLFGIWLTADDLGLHLKLPGTVHADPNTGQITSVFEEGTPQTEGIPQAPVREFTLHFFGGPAAPISTPRVCGTYAAHYEFTPWSGAAPVSGDAPMTIDRGCQTGGFSPKLSGGAVNPVAGAFSSFVTELRRESGEAEISSADFSLPPGVLARIAGVPLCEGDAAQLGECPAASKIGTTTVSAGPGPAPLWIPQPGRDPTAIFLAGPYRGAPYSLVVKVPAQAGPFDLGTVITRAGIYVDPDTAKVTVRSDPLPHFLEGVPTSLRTIHVDVSHPQFTLNPTNCDAERFAAKLVSYEGQVANPSSRFQVGGCRDLGFEPRLSLRLLGKTNRGAHPRFRATLKTRKNDANIATAQVSLPHSEFLDQAHIRTICTRVQFAAEKCPAGSVYGHARAVTPLLDQPLEGPVYLRSSSHRLPDVVVALRGQVDINLVGRIDSIRGGIRTTFEALPDAPVSKFTLAMQGGKKGLFVNSRNLCSGTPSRAELNLGGQNGKSAKQSPLLRNDCGGASVPQRKRK